MGIIANTISRTCREFSASFGFCSEESNESILTLKAKLRKKRHYYLSAVQTHIKAIRLTQSDIPNSIFHNISK